MVPTGSDYDFLNEDESEELQRRAYSRAELKAIQREADAAEKARKANEDFKRAVEEEKRWHRERQEATDWLNAFHEFVVEPAMMLSAETLEVAHDPPEFQMKMGANSRVAISQMILKRRVAYHVRFTIQTTARVPLKRKRRVIVEIASEKIYSRFFLRQTMARLKRQTQIARVKKGGFSLSDLQYDSELSRLVPWFQKAMREVTETHANLIAEEGP